ncbi:MAG: hypothetical protein PHV33_11235 [Elusimicrobiales bacterium]|nr:hypothetical protein [Elusimicrobiales bacterium]
MSRALQAAAAGALFLAAALAFRCWSPVRCGERPRPAGRIMDGFAAGLNYPWINYGWDFGASPWGHRGVSSPEGRAEAEKDFAAMRTAGARVARWFVLCDGRAAPEFDARGRVTGFDKRFYRDLDAALEIAGRSGVRLVLVLFDFHLLDEARLVNGAQLGGRAALLANPAASRSLFDNALRPLLKRYGARQEILAWEIMNEPEWRMDKDGLPGDKVRDFVRRAAELVHEHARQPVTVGSASAADLRRWRGLGLDFYQYHYYEHMNGDPGPGSARLDRPCVLGEFGTAGRRPAEFYLDAALRAGLAGAWAWSYRAGDEQSAFPAASAGFTAWTQAQEERERAAAPGAR